MTTKREQILQAIKAKLTAIPGMISVERTREDALTRSESPSAVITWSGERKKPVSYGVVDKLLSVHVAYYTRGAVPDQVADQYIEAGHALLLADKTLGGLTLDLSEDRTDVETDESDLPTGWIVVTYIAWYRHQEANLAA